MASGRSSLTLLCVCSLVLVLLMADVTTAGDVQQEPTVTGVTAEQFHLRGKPAGAAAEEGADESFESFARRELTDYGRKPASANCLRNCKK